jgi:protein-disulfide isomerase
VSAGRLSVAVGDRDHVAGPADAPVTLVEYGDYECPHCARAHPVVARVRESLGSSLRFVFRHFPLTEAHPHAEHAAEAAEAAAQRGKFWEMHDAIYQHQADGLEDEDLAGYAAALGLDAEDVLAEIEDEAHVERVRADFMGGVRSGVNGTPTFFINGQRFDGDWTDADAFATVLRDAAGRPSHR